MRPLLWFLALSVAVATAITALGVWLLVASSIGSPCPRHRDPDWVVNRWRVTQRY
jgi:hypothetical protein